MNDANTHLPGMGGAVRDQRETDARAVVMPFGKFKGMTLGAVAGLGDEGLLYLDWLVGEHIKSDRLRAALEVVCEAHGAEIEAAVERKGER